MIIAIPIEADRNMVCISFARCPYFMIADTNKDTIRIVDNPAFDIEGEAGVRAAQFMIERNVDMLITPRCGRKAAELLKTADVAIYKSYGDDAKDNMRLRAGGKLEKLTSFTGDI